MSEREERIRQRAYEKWQKEGEAHGWHDRHWAEAESEVDAEEKGTGAVTKKAVTTRKKAVAAATPMMDDAGMPDADTLKSDAGSKASVGDKKSSSKQAAAKKATTRKTPKLG